MSAADLAKHLARAFSPGDSGAKTAEVSVHRAAASAFGDLLLVSGSTNSVVNVLFAQRRSGKRVRHSLPCAVTICSRTPPAVPTSLYI